VRDQLEVAFRLNGERLTVLGWSRAILLQLAHPLIAAGVFEHSGFRASPLAAVQRLHHTTRAMLAITFGDEQRHAAAIDGIRRIHTRVNGTLREAVGPFAAGTPYSAEDPALLLWVHVTLIESILVTYQQLVGPLSRQELDDYCAASAPSSIELGMRDADAPRTWHDLQERLRRTYDSGVIAVGPQARQLADAILRTSLPGPLAPARWISGLLTVGLLPARVRDGYGLAWDATRQRRLDRLTATVRTLRRITPAPLALWADARHR
jgi:uncharacterized protein (DUF2236 family)